jgi:hypothetical protein
MQTLKMKKRMNPMDICGDILGSLYLYIRDAMFRGRDNQYCLGKNVKSFVINTHKGKYKLSLISAHQDRTLINANKKFVLLFLRDKKQQGDNIMQLRTSLEGCDIEQKQQ